MVAARDRFGWQVAAIWLVACAVLLALHRADIAGFVFPDVDDRLRLVEVRDWLGGQAFRDVTQYRMNRPDGAPMHWSRLVDMPIAAVILLLRPFVGAGAAEIAACAVVPLLTLGVATVCVAGIARSLGGRGAGLLAAALAPTTVVAIVQMQPMRIDHHGWEIALSLVAGWALLSGRGVLAGAAMAAALQISLEALPFAVAIGGVAALLWIVTGKDDARRMLVATVAALAIGEAVLSLVFHGARWAVFCDAVSAPHLIGLAVAAIGVAAVAYRDPVRPGMRAALLGAVAVVAALAFRAVPPGCGTDAFADLEPIVRTYWYDRVTEGLPVWRQDAATAVGTVAFPLVALGCALLRWRRSGRVEWGVYAGLLLAATVVGVAVLRAAALANMLGVPATACVGLAAFGRARANASVLVRVFGSVAAICLASPWAAGLTATALLPGDPSPPQPASARACDAIAGIRALAALPPARLFAPLDFGPAILLETPHAVLASGHHRNHAAIADELRAWLGDDATAQAVMRRHGIGYVVACRRYPELDNYARAAPQGLAARLERGAPPAWLRPVAVAGAPTLRLYRVYR